MPDDLTIQDAMAAPVILPIGARLDGGSERGGRAALSIHDGPQALQIFIENESDRRFTLAPGSARIELMLRADVLVAPETVTLDEATTPHWTMEIARDRVEGHVSLVFTPKETLVLTPGAEFGIGLQGLVPDNLGGPRGTQVAVDYEGFVDEEGKSIADHLLRRLALADEEPDEIRIDLLRSGSHASDGVLSLSFAGEGGAIIQPASINGLIPLTVASVTTGQTLDIRADGPRTPAFHIEPPSLEGGPDPIFHDSSIEGALLTNDNRSMTFTQAAQITGVGAQVRLQTQNGTRPGLHPVSIRYENLGPNCNMDGRLVLLVLSHPIRSDGMRAAANFGLVVRKGLEIADDDGQSPLSITVAGDTARIGAPTGGLTVTGGPLKVDGAVAGKFEVTGSLKAQRASLDALVVADGFAQITGEQADLPKTNVMGDLTVGGALHSWQADVQALNLQYRDQASGEAQHGWRACVSRSGNLQLGPVLMDGKDVEGLDQDGGAFGVQISPGEYPKTARLSVHELSANRLWSASIRADGSFKTNEIQFTAMGGDQSTDFATSLVPEDLRQQIAAMAPEKRRGLELQANQITNGLLHHDWKIQLKKGALVFLHNGVEVHRIAYSLESLLAGFKKG